MNSLKIIFTVLGVCVFLFSVNVYADQPPPLVASIQNNPYYYAENYFGIDTLRYFNYPLTPYLTDGVTANSTDKEIMDAYYKANADVTTEVIEQYSDRAISYVVHFKSREIFEEVISYNFKAFNPETNPYQFTLGSLASKDKKGYYEFASRYVNPGKRPDPFDLTIDVVTGDGTVLQKWQYYDCKITYFEIYLQNNLTYLMFSGAMQPEIRDHSELQCTSRYMQADMENIFSPYISLKRSATIKVYDTAKLDKIPPTDERAISYLVSFVGRDIPEEITSQSFQQFGRLGVATPQWQQYSEDRGFDNQFYLESLLSKDKKGYYEYVSRYVNPGKKPERFDVNIDVVTGDGTPLLRWQYYDCQVTKFEAYLEDSVLTIKFHPGPTPEIRDRAEFLCVGFHLGTDFEALFSPYTSARKITTSVSSELGTVIPKDSDRAMSYVVHFANGDFDTTKTIRTFAKFEQTDITEFDLESLPSKDKNEFYDLVIAKTMNPGKTPEPFSVTVDIVAGDETILQKWQYYKCQVTDYQTQLNDNLLGSRFVGKFVSEIREKTSFKCLGQNLVADPLNPVSPFISADVASPTLNPSSEPGGIIPKDENRAMYYLVHIIEEDIPQGETFKSFQTFETHGKTVSTDDVFLVYNKKEPGFVLESLPSKDRENFYQILSKYINPGKVPDPFDVKVDIVSGDDTILQRWQYFDCQIVNYEAYLEDTLIIVKFNPSPAPEIRDTTGLECVGFHFETPRLEAFSPYVSSAEYGEKKISDEKGGLVPNDNDRPLSYVVHFSGGELKIPHTFLTFSKYKQTGKTQFWLEALPSQDKKIFYDLIVKRYVNPGKTPELFDVSIDLVTGDGTNLQSWKYPKCRVTDYVVFRDDNSLKIRFGGKPISEIREKTTFDCSGLNMDFENKLPISPDIDVSIGLEVKPVVPEIVVRPHLQLKSGVPASEIVCKEQKELMISPHSFKPYCVNSHRLADLLDAGWEHIAKEPSKRITIDDSKTDSAILKAHLPKEEERAVSYQLNIIGREIPEEIHKSTWSKFAPFTTGDITIPTAEILGIPIPTTATIPVEVAEISVGNRTQAIYVNVALEDLPLPIPTATIPGYTSTLFGVVPYYQFGDAPSFYLEGLPAKDKAMFHKWIARYVNPGKKPDPIDMSVEILDGSGNTLQTWVYFDCSPISYQIFLEENILMIKYHKQWQTEIKDRVMVLCLGFYLN